MKIDRHTEKNMEQDLKRSLVNKRLMPILEWIHDITEYFSEKN